jgi:Flp pilus assembly protein TadG
MPRSTAKPNLFAIFRRDEDGSLIIFSLFLLIMMLMISGMAVDLMRAETDRARLQSTLDRAVLAGASLQQTLDSTAVVTDYFNKAGLGSYLTSVVVNQGPTSKSVAATAEMTVNSYFMNLLGINTLQSPAAGQAEESLSDVEVSLVLDVSGSMGRTSASGNTKIADLIDAAQEFVYRMQCDPDAVKPFDGNCVVDPNTVSISMVPYAEQVLVGETLLQQFNATSEQTNSSCVDFTTADFSTAAITPTDVLNRSGEVDPWSYYYGSSSSAQAYDPYRSCNPDTSRAVVPYSADYLALQSRIAALTAGGNTSIDVAMKWGTALLDPAFRPGVTNLSSGATPTITPAFAGRPFDYTRPSTQKVIVLMTDGVNTTQHKLKAAYRSGPSPFWKNPSNGAISVYYLYNGIDYYYRTNGGYWSYTPEGGSSAVQMTYPDFWATYNMSYYRYFNWLPYPVDQVGGTQKNTNLDAICTAAKAKGIEVFTLGFETTSYSSAIMSSCASSPSHNFDVDGTSIADAFSSIAREIHELRLTN